jgi:hypothetical protein
MLKAKFLANDPAVPEVLAMEIAVSLENFIAKKVRADQNQFITDLVEIYRFIIEHNLMYYKGEIRYYFYHNVILAGIRIGDLDFVEQFIEDYKSKIAEPYREDLYLYCKAYLLFERGQYNEALQLVLRVNPVLYFNKADLKTMVARLHFELGMFAELETTLESFPYYLSDETLPQHLKERYGNFVKSIRKLAELKQNYNPSEFSKLSEHLERTGMHQSQRWFTEKMNEIANSKRAKRKEEK